MYDLNKTYGERFFNRRRSLKWRAEIVGRAIVSQFRPYSVVDMGCGNGDIIGYISTIDSVKDTLAIEGTYNSMDAIRANYAGYVLVHDLRTTLNKLHSKYDVCLCLEVAEHIEPEYADILVSNLIAYSDTIVFSAAKPGQGGKCHVNCQPEEYWWYKFDYHGFGKSIWLTEQFREKLQPYASKKGIKAYAQNAIVYKRIGT